MASSEEIDPDICHIKTYRNMTDYICNHLKIEDIYGILFSEEMITSKTYQQIRHKINTDGPIAASELLLSETLAMNPNPNSFHKFIEVLRNSRQGFLANQIMKEYNKVRSLAQKQGKKEEKPNPQSQRREKYPQEEMGQQRPNQQTEGPSTYPHPEEQHTDPQREEQRFINPELPPQSNAEHVSTNVHGIEEEGDRRSPVIEEFGEVSEPDTTMAVAAGVTASPSHATDPNSCTSASPNVQLDVTGLSLQVSNIGKGGTSSDGATVAANVGSPGNQDQQMVKELKLDENKVELCRDKPLGSGRFGTVYEGLYLGTKYAVKEVTHFKNRKNMEKNISQNKEIIGSARMRHPSIVQLIGYSIGDMHGQATLLIVFELINGYDLEKVLHSEDTKIREQYQLNIGHKYSIAREISQAITYIHQHGIIHRDIKPANILVTKKKTAKLCDLGLCKIKEGSSLISTIGKPQGTPFYMAHELVLEECKSKASPESDMFAFGVCLYELFSGKYMWGIDVDDDDDNGMQRLKEAMREHRLQAELRQAAVQPWKMIAECVHKEPKDRPQAETILATLKKLEADIGK